MLLTVKLTCGFLYAILTLFRNNSKENDMLFEFRSKFEYKLIKLMKLKFKLNSIYQNLFSNKML